MTRRVPGLVRAPEGSLAELINFAPSYGGSYIVPASHYYGSEPRSGVNIIGSTGSVGDQRLYPYVGLL